MARARRTANLTATRDREPYGQAHGFSSNGHGSRGSAGGPHLSTALEGFRLHKSALCSPHTVRDYMTTLKQWAAFLGDDPPVAALTDDDVKRFLYHLRAELGRAPKTVRNAHIGISALFTWLAVEYGIEHQVQGHVPTPRAAAPEIKPLTKGEVRGLLDACDRTAVWESTKRAAATTLRPTRVRDRALIVFLLDTGVRAQELCDLKIGDWDRRSGAVQVRAGKGGKGRTVYVGTLAGEALGRYLGGRRFTGPDDPLFATTRHGPMDRDALRHMLEGCGKRAELAETVTPHRFRHTFAINYLRNGGDVFTLQRLLGHATMEMVRRYLAIAQVDIAEAHKRASPADNWRLG